MGEVYRAHDERLDRDVAIKVLPEEVAQDEAGLARFEREAKLLAAVSHQNIATPYGFESFNLTDVAAGFTPAGQDVADTDEAGDKPPALRTQWPDPLPNHGAGRGRDPGRADQEGADRGVAPDLPGRQ
jgi:hypothetical protein